MWCSLWMLWESRWKKKVTQGSEGRIFFLSILFLREEGRFDIPADYVLVLHPENRGDSLDSTY